jgi:CheY-like chemotaxis protein
MSEAVFNARDMKLLCVDDSQTNLAILKDTFKGEDYQLAFSSSGEDALDIIFDFLPDLVLLDVMMPGIDGYGVCRRIKEDLRTKEIPVIFISGLDEALQKNLGFSVGCVDYITKPFDSLDVVTRVKTHLCNQALLKENRKLKQRIKDLEGE